MRTVGLVSKLALTLAAATAVAACGPTCSGSISIRPAQSSNSAAGNGTQSEDLTFSGQFGGHVTSAFAFCTKTNEAFQGFVQDTKAGSLLRFDFRIPAAAYHGPGSYGAQDGNPTLGTVYMAGQLTWTSRSGTFTVNPGEKSGSIHMHLEAGPNDKPEDISGSWRCG